MRSPVLYATGHPIRVHILILLNEGVYTAMEIARILDEQLNNVSNHLSKMLEHGAIEIAHENKRGNLIQYAYKSVGIACFSQEEVEEMTQLQRQMTVGAIYQSGTAEVLAALYAGRLADPRRSSIGAATRSMNMEGRRWKRRTAATWSASARSRSSPSTATPSQARSQPPC